jgi:glucosamine kinase
MLKFYLFEAGATKTTFLNVHETGVEEILMPPFNANRDFTDFENAVKLYLDIEENSKIIFYGSGCANLANKEKVRQMFQMHKPSSLEVHDDIIAAARSVFGTDEGVIGVLGTGGLAAFYNGKEISSRRGGYGYLLGDLGGGLELGKRFLATWLNGDLSPETNAYLIKKIEIESETFVSDFYKAPDFSLISTLSVFALEFEYEKAVKEMLERYFDDYVVSNIHPICHKHGLKSFCTVGSIGYLFRSHLEKSASKVGLTLELTIKDPANALVEFHRKQQ